MQAAKQTRIHYLIAGLAVGGLWLLDRDKSLLYHAVQMTAAAGEHPASLSEYARLLGAKLVLVAVAVGAEWLLAPVTPRSNGIVAAGLVVLVTALGPLLDSRATNQAMPAMA